MGENVRCYSASELTAGHPDRIQGQIFEAVLSDPLKQDFSFRVARETRVNFILNDW